MAIKTILVAASGMESSRPTLDLGLMVGKHLGAHVDVIHVKADPLTSMPAIGEGLTTSIAEEIESTTGSEASQKAKTAKEMYDACVDSQKGVATTWIEAVGRADVVVSRRARLADLLVVGKPTFKAKLPTSGTAQAGLLETGRPVLVAPPEAPKTFGKHIAIAWNGSAEASRAVAAATNFFGLADKITILTAESARTSAKVAEQMEAYLDRHGVHADKKIFAHMGEQYLGGEALLKACDEVGADLLVMGAFVATGMRELVMGNATQQVLTHAKLPVLMGH